jgi:hypothetical protein
MKGIKMNRFFKIAMCIPAVILVLTLVVGCKKEEPAPEPESARTERAVTEEVVTAEPKLREGIKINAAGKPIDIEVGHLVPCVTDWNSDGKKDLIVGQFANGAIRLYLNEGTDTEPVFGDSTFLQAGGKPIKLDAG